MKINSFINLKFHDINKYKGDNNKYNGNLVFFLTLKVFLKFKFIKMLFNEIRKYKNVVIVFKRRITRTLKIIFLFIINIIVIILGIKPKNGGIPAILKKIIKLFRLLIFLILKIVIVCDRKFIFINCIDFVADKVIKE